MEGSPAYRIQLEAFANIVLNMFDLVLAELEARPNARIGKLASGEDARTWSAFFEDVVRNSSLIRQRLERSEGISLYRSTLWQHYKDLQLTKSTGRQD